MSPKKVAPARRAPTKRLTDYLPSIFLGAEPEAEPEPKSGTESDPGSGYDGFKQSPFLALYLRPFEELLFGSRDLAPNEAAGSAATTTGRAPAGLEEEVAAIPSHFDPFQTPEEFLPWLASWAALSFHPDLSVARRRNLLANIIPLYRIRGTRKYIEQLLSLCLETFVSVTDTAMPGMQLGIHSTVGLDALLNGGPPHFFSVRLIAAGLDEGQSEVQLAIARYMISLAKPAHTDYDLTLVSPRMQLGVNSTIGLDTVLAY